jgi:cytochrome P450
MDNLAGPDADPGGKPETVSFSPLDPALADDFWPLINGVRERCPVAWSEASWSDTDSGFWLLNTYAEVLGAATNWRVYSSADGASPVQFDLDVLRMVPLETDPPLHRSIRRLLNPFFAPEALEAAEPGIRRTVSELIDRCAEESPVDFVARFTALLPPIVFFETFLDQRAQDIGWILEVLDTLLTKPDQIMEAAPRLLMWCAELLESRRARGRRDDLAGAIAHMGLPGSDDGLDLEERQRVETLNLTVMAGMETTMGGLASIARLLAARPDIRETLRDAEPRQLDRAVEEFLRFETPVPTAGRTIGQDTRVRGCPMKKGDRVLLNWAAANRDPEKFPDPDTLNFDRENGSAHLAFGGGIHRCLGNLLARREIKAAIQAICQLTVLSWSRVSRSATGRPSRAVRSASRSRSLTDSPLTDGARDRKCPQRRGTTEWEFSQAG